MNKSVIPVVFAALGGVLAIFIASALRRRRAVDVLKLSDVIAWFESNDSARAGELIRRITVLEAAHDHGMLVRQGYFDPGRKEFLRSRIVRAHRLDEELERLHATNRVVVYE